MTAPQPPCRHGRRAAEILIRGVPSVGEDFYVAMQRGQESIADGVLDHMVDVMVQQNFVVFPDPVFFALLKGGEGGVLAKPCGHGFDGAGKISPGAG